MLPQPYEIVVGLVELGPRPGDSEAHRQARTYLSRALEAMRSMESVRGTDPTSAGPLEARLRGRESDPIVLAAHFDSVATSPGALDNASGCAVALSVVARMAQYERRRTFRLALFDREEDRPTSAGEWLDSLRFSEEGEVLASLHLEMLGNRSVSSGVVRVNSAGATGESSIAPAWLVQVVLLASRETGFEVVVADRMFPLLAQLAARFSRPPVRSDADAFAERGIPSLVLTDHSPSRNSSVWHSPEDSLDKVDGDRLQRWADVVTAIARRLDAVAGRPVDEREYLVLFGRVWTRRDLIWPGFIIWLVLVFRGLPGSWRDATSDQRRRRGREYLPSFAFRMSFLLALFLTPTASSLLLYPVGVVAIFGHRAHARRSLRWWTLMPAVILSLWLAVGEILGWHRVCRSAVLPTALTAVCLASLWAWWNEPRTLSR